MVGLTTYLRIVSFGPTFPVSVVNTLHAITAGKDALTGPTTASAANVNTDYVKLAADETISWVISLLMIGTGSAKRLPFFVDNAEAL